MTTMNAPTRLPAKAYRAELARLTAAHEEARAFYNAAMKAYDTELLTLGRRVGSKAEILAYRQALTACIDACYLAANVHFRAHIDFAEAQGKGRRTPKA